MVLRIITLIFSLALFQLSAAEEKAPEKKDTFEARGKVKVLAQADRARVWFSIESFGKSLEEAFAGAHQKIDSIAAKLEEIGLDRSHINTSFFKSSENLGKKAFLSSKKDYRTVMSGAITTDRLDLLESIVVILSRYEVEDIKDITFELTSYEQLKQDALEKAVSKAREKAEMMARILGFGFAGVLEVEEVKKADPGSQRPLKRLRSSVEYPNPFNATITQLAEGGSGVFAHEMEFEVEVRVVYEISNDEFAMVPATASP